MQTRTTLILTLTIIITLAAGSAFGTYSGGTGDPCTPYQIATKADLLALAANPGDYGLCFIMTADIDMQGQVFTTAIISAGAFTGTFDGNGHKITNFTINGGSNSCIGLFGYIDSGGSVKNLNLENCSVSGSNYVGGLVGYNYGGSISNCYSTNPASGYAAVGGLVGYNDSSGSISNCDSTGAVSGQYDVGGLVGWNVGTISNCYSTGTVSGSSGSNYVGGLVGENTGTISNCYSTGAVTGSGSGIGGLAGFNTGGGSVSGSFWDTQTSGQNNSAGGTGETTALMQTKSTFTNAGWDFAAIWDIIGGQTYPFFKSNISGTGTPGDPYRIATQADLLTMAADTSYYSNCFILTADINMGGQVFTTAIIAAGTSSTNGSFQGTAFTGTFDGNGHKITNFTINGGSNCYLGLFGYINSGGSVKNLGLEKFTVSGDILYVGGLAGGNHGSVSNCYSTGAVSGGDEVGGLVGLNWSGSISNCYATGTVSGSWEVGGLVGINFHYYTEVNGVISNCYSTGAVSGGDEVGGLVGYNYWSTVSNCYSTGAVSSTSYVGGLVGNNNDGSISNCYSTGAVSGTSYVGGLVGINGSSISNSFWDTESSGQTTSVGGTGETTTQMKTLSTFTSAGWDFTSVWVLPMGQYPMLFLRQAGDLNYDGRVDFVDFALFADHWLSGE